MSDAARGEAGAASGDERAKLAAFIKDWDRIVLESGAGDWLDTHELPDAERDMVIAALVAAPQAGSGWRTDREEM